MLRCSACVLALAIAQVACSRPSPAPAPAPEPEPDRMAGPTPEPAHALVPAPPGEASRSRVPRLDAEPLLLPHLSALRDHFGASAKGPFALQRIGLAEGRTAILVSRADESEPFVVAFDRDELLWSKPHPVAGILSPLKQLTIAPRPDGGAVIFAWVAPLHMVAARMWADDGNPFGDFELFSPDACDALSAAYGPGQGWVTVCASTHGTRAQRTREDCTMAWGHAGAAIGSTAGSGPAAIAFDSSSSFVLLERVAAVGGHRLLAFRYDGDAEPLWPAPVDLGMDVGGEGTWSTTRIEARVIREGLVRVQRPLGVAGKGVARATELTSSGALRFL